MKPRARNQSSAPPSSKRTLPSNRPKRPSRKHSAKPVPSAKRRPAWIVSTVLLSILLVLGLPMFVSGGTGEPIELSVQSSDSALDIGHKVRGAGAFHAPWWVASLITLHGGPDRIPMGTHVLVPGMSPWTIVRRLMRRSGTTVVVTLPEGFNSFDVASRLAAKGVCARAAFLSAVSDPVLLAHLRVKAHSAEGYLFPATYEFNRNEDPDTVVEKLVLEADRRYAKLFDEHADQVEAYRQNLGWSRHELITLASVVEKEAGVDDERPLIASVFVNRMYDKSFRPYQHLQSDPTARYGCLANPGLSPTCVGVASGVTSAMVHDPLNPYSTYAHPGLPPGPIANPGENSLSAVLAPAKTDFLFFVAIGAGRHKFSRSFEEHRNAIGKD